MTGRNGSLTIDLGRLLAITGYRVRLRTNGWVECLLLGPQESFIGHGDDQNEALINALHAALPTRLAQRLLERALAEPVPEAAPNNSSEETVRSPADERLTEEAVDVDQAPASSEVSADDSPASDPERRSLSQDEVRAYLEEWTPPPRPVAPPPIDPQQLLRSLIDRARTPSSLASDVEIIDELELLDEVTTPDQMDRWVLLPADTQRVWLGYLVARMRAVKERAGASLPDLRGRVSRVIQRFPEFSARTRPGHVNGLMLAHKPITGAWTGDAQQLLQDLRAMGWPPREDRVPEPRPTPRPSRELREDDREEPPIAWEHREAVASMRVVMYGGSPREDARAKLERALGIETLEWPDSARPRRVEALAQRIASGSIDLLLVLRSYVHHMDANKLIDAARAGRTPFALVDVGYGVEAVKAAISDALRARS